MVSDDKRQAIMQTAERLFKHRRIHEITLDEVAQKAQVGKGTIYRFFANKDDLFFQVATSGFEELCALVRAQAPGGAGFEEQLLRMCQTISAFFQQRKEMFRIMQAEDARMPGCQGSLRKRWFEHRQQLVEAMAEVIDRGVAAGLVRADIPAQTLAALLLGLMRARAMDLGELPEADRPLAMVVDLFLNGAKPRNAEGGVFARP